MKQYLTNSEKETKNLAKIVQQAHHKNRVFALSGQLGTGKTTFVQGFAKGLGIKEKIVSPTFVLIKEYEIVRQHKVPKTKNILYHIDLYRVDRKQVGELGLKELIDKQPAIGRTKHFILIEWAEKAKSFLPKETIWVRFEQIDEFKRRIIIH